METKLKIKNLDDMLRSEKYQIYQSETLLNIQNHIINNPSKDIDLMIEYNNEGMFGCSHSEFIENWEEYLNSLSIFDSNFDDIEDIENFDITQETFNLITKEIEKCYAYHQVNGTLNDII